MSSSNPSSPAVENWLSSEQWPEEIIACRYDRSHYLNHATFSTVREVHIRIQFASGTTSERCHELLQAVAPPKEGTRTVNSIHTDAGFAIVPAMSARFVDELDYTHNS